MVMQATHSQWVEECAGQAMSCFHYSLSLSRSDDRPGRDRVVEALRMAHSSVVVSCESFHRDTTSVLDCIKLTILSGVREYCSAHSLPDCVALYIFVTGEYHN